MEIYLDNSATTKVFPLVSELMTKILLLDYGNPSSLHLKGFDAEKEIRTARKEIADALKVKEKEIIFTSGGTESDNLALIGCARANKRAGKHIITTCVEHSAVKKSLNFLEEEEGYEVTYLSVDGEGFVDLDELKDALREDTILVSIMYVNNEIGAKEPVLKAANIVKKYNKNIVFHTDAVQGFGKYKIRPAKENIDVLSISSHKIHGPKGVGALYVKEGIKISPILFGGGQEKNIRSGTENVPGIAGIGLATKLIYENLDEKTKEMRRLKQILKDGIESLGDVYINGSIKEETSAPHILSCSFLGVRSEVLLHALEEKGIFVSSGSACSSNNPGKRGVLANMGASKEQLESTIRFSFSEFTTEEEIKYTINVLKTIVPTLRRFTRK